MQLPESNEKGRHFAKYNFELKIALIGHVTINDSNHDSKLLTLHPGSLSIGSFVLSWKLKKLDHSLCFWGIK